MGCSTYAHGSVSSAAPVFMLCLPSLALQVGPVAVKSWCQVFFFFSSLLMEGSYSQTGPVNVCYRLRKAKWLMRWRRRERQRRKRRKTERKKDTEQGMKWKIKERKERQRQLRQKSIETYKLDPLHPTGCVSLSTLHLSFTWACVCVCVCVVHYEVTN